MPDIFNERDLRERLAQLQSQRTAVKSDNDRINVALELRNAALDASTTHFMIVDARQECRPIVYVNRALARAHGYERPEDLIECMVFVESGSLLALIRDHGDFSRTAAQPRLGHPERENQGVGAGGEPVGIRSHWAG